MKIPFTNHTLPLHENPIATLFLSLLFILGMTHAIGSVLKPIFISPSTTPSKP